MHIVLLRRTTRLLTLALLLTSFLGIWSVQAVSPDVVISQVYGGGSNSGATLTNDFIELYNRGTLPVDLSGWSVQYGSVSGTTWNNRTDLVGIVQPGQYYLIQEAPTNVLTPNLPTPDLTGAINLSGSNGKVALVSSTTALSGSCPLGGTVVDFVGYGSANCYEGSAATGTLNNTSAAIRNGDGSIDTDDNSNDFTVGTPNPRNSTYGFDAAPAVTSVSPGDGATDVAVDADLSVTFSEAVSVTGTWFALDCTTSGSHTVAVSGGPSTFTLNPDSDFTSPEICTATIYAAQVSDQDSQDPPDTMDADLEWSFTTVGPVCDLPFTPIYAIQGSGSAAAITGSVSTQGVVVGDYEGSSPALRGFYIQDASGDGDSATSDGLFVFNGNSDSVNLGDVVRVTGNAGEFQDQTQISSVSNITVCGTDTVTPVDVTLPLPAADYLERYEGMLVRLPQTLYVTEHFQLGRFGQVVLSSGGRLQQPTNVAAPGPSALALQQANDLNRIILDDATNNQNPDPILFARDGQPLSASNTLRGGDTATDIVGILTYTWAGNNASGNAYRVRPLNALGGGLPTFVAANPRPAASNPVSGTLRVAGMNLLNFFNTFDGLPDNVDNCTNGLSGSPADCRGANTQDEFDRQWPKTVAAIIDSQADIVGIVEIENDGYAASSAIAFLVDKLNAASALETYAFIDVDSATGQVDALGDDAIKVGLLYKPAAVTPVGTTAALNSVAFVNGGDSAPRNRPSLAQAFEQPNGERVIVDVNHFKSKGSACDAPDSGDGQANCNAVRVNAATALAEWLASDPTGTGDPDILIVGDLNAYAQEDPITTLTDVTHGYTNLIESLLGADAYSYVFDGQWGYLDHAIGSATLVGQVSGVGEWHINADEPNVLDYNTDFQSAGQIISLYNEDEFRISDHDPVLVGLCLAGVAPQLSVSVTPNILRPANHKYVTVNATVSTSSPDATISLVGVTSNEPDNGLGDGDTPDDMVTVDDTTFQLRAERAASGSGRVYTITYQATDTCGDTTIVSATVTVPHDQGKKPKSDDTAAGRSGNSLIPEGFHGLYLPGIQR